MQYLSLSVRGNPPLCAAGILRFAAGLVCTASLLFPGSALAGVGPHPVPKPQPRAVQQRLPHGSFVLQQVHTAEELTRHLDKHPEIARRYALLTNMTPRMVKLAIGRLQLKRLEEATSAEVYYCHHTTKGEVLGFRRRRIPRGTAVFAFPDGTPAIIQACGNPTRALATAPISAFRIEPLNPVIPSRPAAVVESEPLQLPELAQAGTEFHIIDDFQEVSSAELYVPEQPALPPARLAAYSTDTLHEWVRNRAVPGGRSINLRSIAAAPLGLALLTFGGDTDANVPGSEGTPIGGEIPELPKGGPDVPPGGGIDITGGIIAVPEPTAAMLALAIGASCAGVLLRRRSRR